MTDHVWLNMAYGVLINSQLHISLMTVFFLFFKGEEWIEVAATADIALDG